jgi:RNA polymerase sigma-70 factor (ECF subfamily)
MPATILVMHSGPESVETAAPETAARDQALERFLRAVERRALRMAELALDQRDDALDAVQDAMLVFVKSYSLKPAADWAPLFYRVLDSRIHDAYRRRSVRARWRQFVGRGDEGTDPLAEVADPAEPGPAQRAHDGDTRRAVDAAIKALPQRQRQAFLLRIWEGFDVAQTALAMGCSEGSVKTHLSRAMDALRGRLEDYR